MITITPGPVLSVYDNGKLIVQVTSYPCKRRCTC